MEEFEMDEISIEKLFGTQSTTADVQKTGEKTGVPLGVIVVVFAGTSLLLYGLYQYNVKAHNIILMERSNESLLDKKKQALINAFNSDEVLNLKKDLENMKSEIANLI